MQCLIKKFMCEAYTIRSLIYKYFITFETVGYNFQYFYVNENIEI